MSSVFLSSSSDSDGEAAPVTPIVVRCRSKHEGAGVLDTRMRALLQFGLEAGKPRWRDQGGGWMARAKPKPAEYTDAQIKQFGQIYMDDLYALTGIKMSNFQLTPSTRKYASMFDFARARDRVLATLLERRPKIWDLHAGSGADSFAFLADMDPVELVMCQRSIPDGSNNGEQFEASKREYDVMCSNIENFVGAAGIDALVSVEGRPVAAGGASRRVHIKCKHKLAEGFIMSVPEGSEVDIVYADPSWDDDHDIGGGAMYGREMTPHELFMRLDKLIFGPIRRRSIKVGCYVIKTRWNLLKVEQYLHEVKSEFIATYSLRAKPFRPNLDGIRPDQYEGSKGVYYYMVLTHREYKTIDFQPSQMYWNVIRNGTPVWVKKDTMVKLIRPVYSDHAAFPVWTDTDPKSEAYTKITPHSKLGRKGAKGVGPHNPEERTTYNPRKFDPEEVENETESSEDEPQPSNAFASRNPYDRIRPDDDSD